VFDCTIINEMKIIRARVLGFCMGVKRAVDLAHSELACSAKQKPGKKVYTLGALIHNPQTLEDLKCRGVETLDEECLPENLNGASVIIRAHGISPKVEAELLKRRGWIVDATCPRVKANQLKARDLAKAGYYLFLVGEEHHAEIIGIWAYAQEGALQGNDACLDAGNCIIVGSAAEAEKAAAQLYREDPNAKTALIGQTTISSEEFLAIGEVVIRFFPDLEIARTICPATRERQDSLRELMNQVDAVIVVGGKESANTRRLLAIAKTAGKTSAIVESPADIPPEYFSFNTVGLAAGASSPDAVINAVELALRDRHFFDMHIDIAGL
jgi:4-hydroxy-3-methylbut-2-enyl diphosphate reductase